MANKMTYVSALEIVINGEAMTEEVKAKLEALKASLEKKNGGEKKPTATQVANQGLQTQILSAMVSGEKYTVSEILALVPALGSKQKTSFLVTALLKAGLVNREEIKRKAYFSVVEV